MQWAIGFDPGKDKCGLAVQDASGQILWHRVVPTEQAIATIGNLCQNFPIQVVVMGNQTTSKRWRSQLAEHFPDVAVQVVDEKFTSQLARRRYWQMYPARGCQRLLPVGMRVPPRPIDDIVAIILLERFVQEWQS